MSSDGPGGGVHVVYLCANGQAASCVGSWSGKVGSKG